MSHLLLIILSIVLASYFYRIGFRNGHFEGMTQMSEIWPIDLSCNRSIADIRN